MGDPTRGAAAALVLTLGALAALGAAACQPAPSGAAPSGASTPAVGTVRQCSLPAAQPQQAPSAAPSVAAPTPSVAPPRAPRAANPEKVRLLKLYARELGADQFVIWQRGTVLAEFGQHGAPLQSMSITKTVLGLAALSLIEQGKLSLEQPVADFFPQWKDGDKSQVQVGHLLAHTSGLREPSSTLPIYNSRDFVAYALSSELVSKPGEKFVYGNNAANLLSGVVAKASGKRADLYVAETLFKPLGIHRFWWSLDRAKNAQGMVGLHINAAGLLKLGQLVVGVDPLSRSGHRPFSRELLARATSVAGPVQPNHKRLGLLWWLVPEWNQLTLTTADVAAWQEAGVAAAFVEQMRPLVGRKFSSANAYRAAVLELRPEDPELARWDELTWKAGLPDVTYSFGDVIGCYAAGTLGQYLVILPRDGLIAVRMRKPPKRRQAQDPKDFPGFVAAVRDLVAD